MNDDLVFRAALIVSALAVLPVRGVAGDVYADFPSSGRSSPPGATRPPRRVSPESRLTILTGDDENVRRVPVRHAGARPIAGC